MDKKQFISAEQRLAFENVMSEVDRNQSFWEGYRRGLRIGFFGDWFGTTDEHARWEAYANHDDPMYNSLGKGYASGLQRGKMILEGTESEC